MSIETGGQAFPGLNAEMTGIDSDGTERWETESSGGMTLRQYAAIKLKVPDSGNDWLDAMIVKSLRDDFAANAMQAHVYAQWAQHYATKPGDEVNNHWGDKDIALCAYDISDAMLEARK